MEPVKLKPYTYRNSGWLEPIVNSVRVQGARGSMPVVRGRIGDAVGNVLRDTGCSGAIVRQNFVDEHQYTACMEDTGTCRWCKTLLEEFR